MMEILNDFLNFKYSEKMMEILIMIFENEMLENRNIIIKKVIFIDRRSKSKHELFSKVGH